MIQRQDYPTYIYLHSDLVITKFKPEVDDIKDYRGDKNVYLEPGTDIAPYYEITEEEHFAYEKQREEAEHPEHDIHMVGDPEAIEEIVKDEEHVEI